MLFTDQSYVTGATYHASGCASKYIRGMGSGRVNSTLVGQNYGGLDPAYLRLTIQEVCPGNRRLRGLQSRQPPLLRIPQEGHLDHDAVQSQVSERGVHGNPLPLEVDGECLIRGHRALLESIVIVSYPIQLSALTYEP